MKILKYIGFLILFIIVLLAFLLFSLNSSTLLNLIAKQGIDKAGINFTYQSLKGGLFSGLKIKGANYEDKAKADLEIDADFSSLASSKIDIKTLKATNVWIDKRFLESLIDSNSTKDEHKSSSINPIKSVKIDHLDIGLRDIAYQTYLLNRADLKVDHFQYDMKKQLSGDIKFKAVSNVADVDLDMKIIKSHYVGDLALKGEKSFLNKLLQDENVTFDKLGTVKLHVDGDLNSSYFLVNMGKSSINYKPYRIDPQYIKIDGNYNIKSNDLKSKLSSSVKSNIADLNLNINDTLNLDDINNTLNYEANVDILGLKPEFASVLGDENLSFKKVSKVKIVAKGDMKNVDANVTLKDGEVRYQNYIINPDEIKLVNHVDIKNLDIDSKGDMLIDSNVAKFDLIYKTLVSLKDINNTLKIDLHSHIDPKEEALVKLLKEENITLTKAPALKLDIVTDKRVVHSRVRVDASSFGYEELKINPQDFNIVADYDLDTSFANAKIKTNILSNTANLNADANATFKLSDLNNTLHYSANTQIRAKEGYLKKILKNKNVKFEKLSPLKLHVMGDAKKLKSDLSLNGWAKIAKEYIHPTIKNSSFVYDLKEHTLDGDIDINLKSSIADVSIKGDSFLDQDDLNNSLKYNLLAKISQKKSFRGLNLRELGLIKLKAQGSLKKLDAKLSSLKLNALVKSEDFDTFNFDLDSKNLYIDRLYKKVPPELKKSFIALWAKGSYCLSEQKGEIEAKVKRLKLSNRHINTNRFTIKIDGNDFKLTPLQIMAKGFKLSLDASSKDGRIKAHLNNKAIKANVDFQNSPLYANGSLDIPSVEKLLKEINKIYPLKGVPSIKGNLKLRAKMVDKNRAKISLKSDYIKLKEGEFKDIGVEAFYKKGRIDIPRFGFWLKDFEPKEMNREVKLAHPSFITFDENNNTKIDFVLKDFLSFKGQKQGDVVSGKFSTHKLYLGLKGYGETKLTTDIDMFQSSKQLAVSGDITFEETEVSYESRYLDVSKDPDIIIIDEKHKKKRLADDSFRKNTFLDLHIKSKDAIVYKVEAGTVEMKPDIEVRKEFNSNVKILGKINIEGGEYDIGDKRFTIKEGAVAFRGQEDVNPLLDIHVEYPIDEVVILIDVRGDKRKPKLIFKSKPMMSKKDIFSYLLFGFAVSESDGAQSSAANAAEKIFGRALAKDLARELNLDRLDLTRSQLGGVNVKAGKKVNKKTIIYYQNKDQTSSMIIERKLGRHFELDTEVGQNGQAVDLYYKKGFK